eukprot:1122170-Pleurochrysis_carterae.AAC.1
MERALASKEPPTDRRVVTSSALSSSAQRERKASFTCAAGFHAHAHSYAHSHSHAHWLAPICTCTRTCTQIGKRNRTRLHTWTLALALSHEQTRKHPLTHTLSRVPPHAYTNRLCAEAHARVRNVLSGTSISPHVWAVIHMHADTGRHEHAETGAVERDNERASQGCVQPAGHALATFRTYH